MMMQKDMINMLARMYVAHRHMYGPFVRDHGSTIHVKKELDEVAKASTNEERMREWIDIALLAIDSAMRHAALVCLQENEDHAIVRDLTPDEWAEEAPERVASKTLYELQRKMKIIQMREYPDWRTIGNDAPVEHNRSEDDVGTDTPS